MSGAERTDAEGSSSEALVRPSLAGALLRFAVVLPGQGHVASVLQRAAFVRVA